MFCNNYVSSMLLSLLSLFSVLPLKGAVVSVDVGANFTGDATDYNANLPFRTPSNPSSAFGVRPFFVTLPSGSTNQFIAFCIELTQSISVGSTVNFESSTDLNLAARDSNVSDPTWEVDGQNITKGPTGGIGDARAAQLRYLVDNFWMGQTTSDWWVTQSTPTDAEKRRNLVAFQAAVWEITHDMEADFSLSNDVGRTTDMWMDASTAEEINIFNVAQGYLDAVDTAWDNGDFDSTYQNQVWITNMLESSQYATSPANGAVQDLMYVTPVPEPSTALGAGALAGLIAFSQLRRRRWLLSLQNLEV